MRTIAIPAPIPVPVGIVTPTYVPIAVRRVRTKLEITVLDVIVNHLPAVILDMFTADNFYHSPHFVETVCQAVYPVIGCILQAYEGGEHGPENHKDSGIVDHSLGPLPDHEDAGASGS